jgi:hypothetical protein
VLIKALQDIQSTDDRLKKATEQLQTKMEKLQADSDSLQHIRIADNQ